jgi:hypothetical protein
MTLATIFAFVKPFFTFIGKYWKQISWVGLLIWAIICTLSHCSGKRMPWENGSGVPDTVSVKVDSIWVYPDTSAIFALYGFDTIPIHIEHLNDDIRKLQARRPQAPAFRADADCSDSVRVLLAHRAILKNSLNECDSILVNNFAIRTYRDTIRNDSIEVSIMFKVQGTLKGEPKIDYRYLAPYPVITNTITLKDPPSPPRRQVYVGGGVGPRLNWNGNGLDAIVGSAELGYTNRKFLSVGLAGDFSQNDYGVRLVIRKGFSVGK